MKKVIIIILVLLITPVSVYATGGGLRKATIKTCPDGITYGMHSDGQGGTHWHRAATNGQNYYATGESVGGDPCPEYTQNQGTASAAQGNNKNWSNNNYSNNNATNNNQTKSIKTPKSNDISIKSLTVNGNKLEVSNEIKYETTKKHINIDLETNDQKAKASFENKELNLGINTIYIKIIAEDGTTKDYILTVNRVKGDCTATITDFEIGGRTIEFDNNESTYTKLKGEKELTYSYTLSDDNATLKVLLNNKETEKLNNIKKNDIVKLIVTDIDDNEKIYKIKITEASLIESIIAYFLAVSLLVMPIVGIGIVIYLKFFKKEKNKEDN